MLEVSFQSKFSNEKNYVFDVLFNEILGLEYLVTYHQTPNYQIKSGNKIITINDVFFAELDENVNYYNNYNLIPEKIKYLESELCSENDIPILYGDVAFDIDLDNALIGADIIASVFFMLSRWEEIACVSKDKHNRPDENEMLAVKFDFYHRPIVNEYVEFLWNVFNKIGFKLTRKNKQTDFYLTHDVDFFSKYSTVGNYVKSAGGEIIKRRSFSRFRKLTSGYCAYLFKNQKDPFDTFDYLMNIAETKSIKARFYFIPAIRKGKDVHYSILQNNVKNQMSAIAERGHYIGIHPSLKTYNNEKLFKAELDLIKSVCTNNIDEGRQHFLMFENPLTWQIWDEYGMRIDSTIGFNSHAGFRAGICQEYSIFDVVLREKLKLKERPLILMDIGLRRQCNNQEEFLCESKKLIDVTRKYSGDFVMLWHNSNINYLEWDNWGKIYEKIVDYF
ncbi:MAG: polysaccharide deacetylase family protein [Bacteroidales bacterium]|nr:polysaccharide deacetylase family protein [Bacteroidales bacterium]MDD4218414.1 polysaccharide deacetylase family protein [Bacteroidales bacterium]MDY0140437.1 polysaccharide deacetylase family protein [Bacteroidales bacterium]